MKRKIISIDDLPRATQSDIIDEIAERVPTVDGDTGTVHDNLIGLEPSTPVVLTAVDPQKMMDQFQKHRKVSQINVEKLRKILRQGGDLDPILIAHGRFLDGGHRVTAYVLEGRKKMAAVDIGHLLKMGWEKWIAGDNVDFKLKAKA